MSSLAGVLAFLGALVGAGVPAIIAVRRLRQDARGEWRQRLDQAMALYLSDTADKRQVGAELLADLFDSDLGSPADRALARRLAQIRVITSNAPAIAGTEPTEE